MDNILVIEDKSTNLANALGVRSKLTYSGQSTDEEITEWLKKGAEEMGNISRNISKIILPCRIGIDDNSFMGIYIGLHIRLTKQLPENIRFAQIVFLSVETREEILEDLLKQKNKNGLFLFTKGVVLTEDIKVVHSIPAEFIDQDVFYNEILSNIVIEQQKDKGHQLANEWGAFRLAKFAGCSLSIPEPANLFFKYKDTLTLNELGIKGDSLTGRVKKSCKALLVDDQAYKGWFDVLNFILRKKVIWEDETLKLDVFSSFDEAMSFSGFQDYDIIFLDLRLLPEEDKTNKVIDIEEYSGSKILKKIKKENKGTQVIIFTASNKIWNIDKLKEKEDFGADGYYIKESPEFVLSEKFSKENFLELKTSIEKCLYKKPLRDIYRKIEGNKERLSQLKKNNIIDKDLLKPLNLQMDLAYSLIQRAVNKDDYAIAYITLFKCIECINDCYVVSISDYKSTYWTITKIANTNNKLKQYDYESVETKPAKFKEAGPSTFEKIAGFAIQYLALKEEHIRQIGWNIFRRNKFIHPPDEDSLTERQKLEKDKIYSFAGFEELLESISNIIMNLK